jgi:hypothetical protein
VCLKLDNDCIGNSVKGFAIQLGLGRDRVDLPASYQSARGLEFASEVQESCTGPQRSKLPRILLPTQETALPSRLEWSKPEKEHPSDGQAQRQPLMLKINHPDEKAPKLLFCNNSFLQQRLHHASLEQRTFSSK